jgi:hypothetical protein
MHKVAKMLFWLDEHPMTALMTATGLVIAAGMLLK